MQNWRLTMPDLRIIEVPEGCVLIEGHSGVSSDGAIGVLFRHDPADLPVAPRSLIMKVEYCISCDMGTERDDSLYVGTVGPFCEDCYREATRERDAEITELKRENQEYARQIRLLLGASNELRAAKARIAELERLMAQQNDLIRRMRDVLDMASVYTRPRGTTTDTDDAHWHVTAILDETKDYVP